MTTARRPAEELSGEQELDGVGRTALTIRDDVRQIDPWLLQWQLGVACEQEPARMAKVIMAMAMMMPPDETLGPLTDRVWAVTTPLSQRSAS